TGSPFGLDADNHDHPRGGVGHFIQAIAPDFMRDIEAFYDDVEKLVGQIRASPKVAGGKVYIPGEIEAANAETASRKGLPISDDLAGQLARLAGTLGIEAPLYLS
nr:Ldh family oxidoreductase [Hyphomicrobiales bacterium]